MIIGHLLIWVERFYLLAYEMFFSRKIQYKILFYVVL